MYKKSGHRVEPYTPIIFEDVFTHLDSDYIDDSNQNCYT